MTRSGRFSAARLKRMADALRAHVERGEVAGVVTLLARHDEVVVEAFGVQDLASQVPMRRDTIFRIASMTKPIVAAAAMMLVEETKLRLGDPVDAFLPELANPKVLRRLDGPLDDTETAKRAITLRDLLTFRNGIGAVMKPPGTYPIQAAINEAGLMPGPNRSTHTPDSFMAALGRLPLLHHPGEQWLYHTGSDILGVLIARATGMSLGDFLQERIFAPLGMKDTAFQVPEDRLGRLATAYIADPAGGGLTVCDAARGGQWSRPPSFPSGGGGLVSTADDYLAFARMMLGQGRLGATRLLARPTVELMRTDQLTAEQKSASPFVPGFWETTGWGLGMSVVTGPARFFPAPGSFGWDGGFSTSWRSDPKEDLTGILLVQRMMTSPIPFALYSDFWTLAYQAIDD